MPLFQPNVGMPKVFAETLATHRFVAANGNLRYKSAGATIDGVKTLDPGNIGSTNALRAGLLMGKETANGKYATSVIGNLQAAYTGGTSLTVAPGEAAYINSRIGAAGTVTLTGPAVTGGAVRQLPFVYSAINLGTGVITGTALNANEVQTLNFANTPAGTFNLAITDLNGVTQITPPITYSATIATLLANLQAGLNSALGANLVVASGTLVTAVALTFSGAGYTNLPQPNLIRVDANGLTAGSVSISRTTAGVNGTFVISSFVGDTDGSQFPDTFIPDGWSEYIPTTLADVPFSYLPIGGDIYGTQLLPWPAEPALQLWIRQQLNAVALTGAGGGIFTFMDQF